MTTIKFERRGQYGLERFFPAGDSPEVTALKSLTGGRRCFSGTELSRLAVLGVKVERVVVTAGGERPI